MTQSRYLSGRNTYLNTTYWQKHKDGLVIRLYFVQKIRWLLYWAFLIFLYGKKKKKKKILVLFLALGSKNYASGI